MSHLLNRVWISQILRRNYSKRKKLIHAVLPGPSNNTGKITSSSRQKREIDIVASNFLLLIDKATRNDKDVGIWILVPHKVFQTNASLQSPVHEMPVFKDELLDVVKFKEIGITVMELYMW